MRRSKREPKLLPPICIVDVGFPWVRTKHLSDDGRRILARALRNYCDYCSPLGKLRPEDMQLAGLHLVRGLCAALHELMPLCGRYDDGREAHGIQIWEYVVASNAAEFWEQVCQGAPSDYVGIWFKQTSLKDLLRQSRRDVLWNIVAKQADVVHQMKYGRSMLEASGQRVGSNERIGS